MSVAQQDGRSGRVARLQPIATSVTASAITTAPVRGRVAATGWLLSWGRFFRRMAGLLSAWRQDAADRRYLSGLNEYYLRDIGLAREDVAPDPTRTFWR
jgi:uncharacterized protein YjiS (DUF1127 family)